MGIFDFESTVESAIAEHTERFQAWDLCHSAFMDARRRRKESPEGEIPEKEIDELSLHLTAYLASWGMYARDSFLENNNYTVHKKAVRYLLQEKFDPYENPDMFSEKNRSLFENMPDEFFPNCKAEGSLWSCYSLPEVSYKNKEISPIALSKIILGVFGCVPAFDTYVCEYLHSENNFLQERMRGGYTKTNVRHLYEKREELREGVLCVQKKHPELTHMRIVDIYMWQKGKIIVEQTRIQFSRLPK